MKDSALPVRAWLYFRYPQCELLLLVILVVLGCGLIDLRTGRVLE
ncbi:hypothetical protein [Streptomyces sp. NPDC059874]